MRSVAICVTSSKPDMASAIQNVVAAGIGVDMHFVAQQSYFSP
jgi:hypothetical protein